MFQYLRATTSNENIGPLYIGKNCISFEYKRGLSDIFNPLKMGKNHAEKFLSMGQVLLINRKLVVLWRKV